MHVRDAGLTDPGGGSHVPDEQGATALSCAAFVGALACWGTYINSMAQPTKASACHKDLQHGRKTESLESGESATLQAESSRGGS